jgi:hypothetical protein
MGTRDTEEAGRGGAEENREGTEEGWERTEEGREEALKGRKRKEKGKGRNTCGFLLLRLSIELPIILMPLLMYWTHYFMLRKLSPLFLSLLSLSCKFHACVSLDNIFIDVSHDTCPIIYFVGMLLIWCVIFISSCWTYFLLSSALCWKSCVL